jgi:hypothetical protein
VSTYDTEGQQARNSIGKRERERKGKKKKGRGRGIMKRSNDKGGPSTAAIIDSIGRRRRQTTNPNTNPNYPNANFYSIRERERSILDKRGGNDTNKTNPTAAIAEGRRRRRIFLEKARNITNPNGERERWNGVRMATWNIISAGGNRLEAAIRSISLSNIDLCFLTETKITTDKYTKQRDEYTVVATTAKSTAQGGVALVYRQGSKDWHLEGTKSWGPNVIRTVLVEGDRQTVERTYHQKKTMERLSNGSEEHTTTRRTPDQPF